LVEILVVLGIIAILAALLFPAFNHARENARQTNCISNLQQISLAVSQYRKDEGHYPDSLLDLLGEGMRYDGGILDAKAPGYLRVSADSLVCQDDDTDSTVPRSSYGRLSKNPPSDPLPPAGDTALSSFTGDFGSYVWNYWGTRPDGFCYQSAADAASATWKVTSTSHASPGTPGPGAQYLMDPTLPYNFPGLTGTYDSSLPVNVIKNSMSNRFCPPSTIITHCVYHRLPTASNLNSPGDLYLDVDNSKSKNANDIVTRLDATAKRTDVSTWKTDSVWQKQLP